MPNNYGLAGGIGSCGVSLSVLFWGLIGRIIINPDNLPADFELIEGARVTK